MTCIYVCIYINTYLHLGFEVFVQHVYVSTMFGTHPRGARPFVMCIFVCCAEWKCVDVYIYVTTFTTLHTCALMLIVALMFMCVHDMHASASIYLIYAFMCLFIYVRTYSFRQTGIRLCIFMYVCAPEEQGTTARSRDTRVPVTGGVACDACLAACCFCRMGGRR